MEGLRGPPLLLERANVLDERPAVVLRQVLPRRHGAAPGRNLPEDLAVALVLNLLGSPVGRLRIQGDRRGAVALAAAAMAGDAVDLRDVLALFHHFWAHTAPPRASPRPMATTTARQMKDRIVLPP